MAQRLALTLFSHCEPGVPAVTASSMESRDRLAIALDAGFVHHPDVWESGIVGARGLPGTAARVRRESGNGMSMRPGVLMALWNSLAAGQGAGCYGRRGLA